MPIPILRGLRVTLRHPRPLLWLYVFSLAIAWLTSLGLRAQIAAVTSTSLASQPLITGFDLGTVIDVVRRIGEGPSGALTPSLLAAPLYLLLTFLLVPGSLLTYLNDTPHKLGSLVQNGLHLFWTFVRITLWTALIAGPILGLLGAAQTAWSTRIAATHTGLDATLLQLIGVVLIFLVAALLRLYFDLVAVHAVYRAQLALPNGKPDRRTHLSLRPALHTLNIPNYLTFLTLTLLGLAAAALFSRSSLRHLARPNAVLTFLFAQLAVFALLFTRLWQRAAQTVAVRNILPAEPRSRLFVPTNPIPPTAIEPIMINASSFPTPAPDNPVSPILPGPDSNPFPDPPPTPDPIPNPEPSVPSLAFPDTTVLHHDVNSKKDLIN